MGFIACLGTWMAGIVIASSGCNTPETAPSRSHAASPPVAVSAIAISGVSGAARVGDRMSLKATAVLADGGTQDVSAQAKWESSDDVVARVSAAGELAALAPGEVDIRASYQTVSASVRVAVSASVASVNRVAIGGVPIGASAGDRASLTAVATFSDGTMQEVTTAATWESSNSVVAQVSAGELILLAAGEVDIRASYRGVDAVAHVSVGPPKTSALSGVVTDTATGRSVSQARIEIAGGPNSGRVAVSDGSGFYSFGGLFNGSFTIEVTASGYEPTQTRVNLSSDTRVDLPARAIAAVTAVFNIRFAKVKDTCTFFGSGIGTTSSGIWRTATTMAAACRGKSRATRLPVPRH